MLVMLALATHVTTARADEPNTVTQTAITSPSDPSFFYDPTDGAYGGITVTGTTNSTDPSNDTVDIDCYTDNGSQQDPDSNVGPIVSGITLNSSGGFSTTVPYSALEEFSQDGECTLRAVPAGTSPTSGLASYAGPRVLVAYLLPYWDYTTLDDYSVVAPQLGAVDTYSAANDPYGEGYEGCGVNMALASTQYFGDLAGYNSFSCSDAYEDAYAGTGNLEVDGQQAINSWDSGEPITVSATQDPSNGDITITETEQLDECTSYASYEDYTYCDEYGSAGIDDDRTIQQAGDGRVVLVTDNFVSTDGNAHVVDYTTSNWFDEGIDSGGNNYFELPGDTSYSIPNSGDNDPLSGDAPATIYGYNDANSGTTTGFDALTYYNAPEDGAGVTFAADYQCCDSNPPASIAEVPFELDVPAGGSASLSLGYATEYSQSALAGDLQIERDMKTLPSVSISSPSAGASETSASVNVTGSVSATTGVKSVVVNGVTATVSGSSYSATVPLKSGANTLTAVLTTNSGYTSSSTESVTYTVPPAQAVTPSIEAWTGSVWLPIANTGSAHRAASVKESLSGQVTPGSAGVKYYFEYGTHGRYNHHSRSVSLAAGKTIKHVALTVGGLSHGATYGYKIVATGKYGQATGTRRTFKVAKSGN